MFHSGLRNPLVLPHVDQLQGAEMTRTQRRIRPPSAKSIGQWLLTRPSTWHIAAGAGEVHTKTYN